MVSYSITVAGSSRSENIYDLVVRLHCLCMRYRYQVRFVHVSGTGMIGQGTDGLSRSSLYEEVMNGKPMLSFLPLRESALKRYDPLGGWIEQWDSELGRSVEILDPEGWFGRGHENDGGLDNIYGGWIPKFRPVTFIWSPPTAVSRIFIE